MQERKEGITRSRHTNKQSKAHKQWKHLTHCDRYVNCASQ